MRFRHMTGGLAVIIAATVSLPTAASAATIGRPAAASTATGALPRILQQAAATHSTIPWKPYRTKPWHDAPGQVCAFGVNVTIVRDHEQFRTLSSYPNGNPQVQEFRGPLFVRYHNTGTGKSVLGNLSGYGWFYYPAGGGADIYAPSHFGATVPVGNHGFPAGEWVISGPSLLIVDSTGAVNIVLIHAVAKNICRALS